MNDLVDFINARLDECAAKAEAARHGSDGHWRQPDAVHEPGRIEEASPGTRDLSPVVTYDEGAPSEAQAAHIVYHDPARVLAEVEAKRRLIKLHSTEEGQHPDFCWHDKHELPCPTLRLLALPYANDPGYRSVRAAARAARTVFSHHDRAYPVRSCSSS